MIGMNLIKNKAEKQIELEKKADKIINNNIFKIKITNSGIIFLRL